MASKTRSFKHARFFGVGSVLILTIWLATAMAAPAQIFQTLDSFNWKNGAFPDSMSLAQGRDGNLYGTTYSGGRYTCLAAGCGTVFKVSPAGVLQRLYSFCSQAGCPDGFWPRNSLVLATDGNFYGTTVSTFFKITQGGRLTTLYTFCTPPDCIDPADPQGGLIQATDGNFYGTSSDGGGGCTDWGCGTVFQITPGGVLTMLYNFCAQPNCADGVNPSAGLIQANDGNFYGTTAYGGNSNCNYGGGCGTVFRITPEGKLTTLHSFGGADDGCFPMGVLVQAAGGTLYGTTSAGGNSNCNSGSGYGTVFRITAMGALTTLYRFCSQPNCSDGGIPDAGLVQATDGNFYGTTYWGGYASNCAYVGTCGTAFKITAGGTLTTLYDFCLQPGCADGSSPQGGLIQATNGTFYGTTYQGGAYSDGTVFSLDMGLGPFVSFVRNSGRVGANVEILGQGFAGTTGVSFNGTPATFTAWKDAFLTATVPAGATTGPVTVTTPSGTLTSNVPFRVQPLILSFSPPSGPVGTSVTITGSSLTQTTDVDFGGVKATTFTVDCDTQITTIAPTRAKTGEILVFTPGGRAYSPGSFTVTQ